MQTVRDLGGAAFSNWYISQQERFIGTVFFWVTEDLKISVNTGANCSVKSPQMLSGPGLFHALQPLKSRRTWNSSVSVLEGGGSGEGVQQQRYHSQNALESLLKLKLLKPGAYCLRSNHSDLLNVPKAGEHLLLGTQKTLKLMELVTSCVSYKTHLFLLVNPESCCFYLACILFVTWVAVCS